MRYLAPFSLLALTVLFVCCANPDRPKPQRNRGAGGTGSYSSYMPRPPVQSLPSGQRVTPAQMLQQEVKLFPRLIQSGKYGRKNYRPMTPRYITIHSTQNRTGDAWAHATALRRGALRDSWHFTVQQNLAIQHMPTTEQARHADAKGPGNTYSIGIEMCEHRGNHLGRTIDRTARLAASLMYKHNIPLRNVVPHYHWPRAGKKPANKNCPHFLLDNGRPGRKWQTFLRIVESHYRRLSN